MLEEELGRIRERLADLLAEVDAIIDGIEDARRRAAEAKAACQRRLYPPRCPAARADAEIRDDDGQVEPPA